MTTTEDVPVATPEERAEAIESYALGYVTLGDAPGALAEMLQIVCGELLAMRIVLAILHAPNSDEAARLQSHIQRKIGYPTPGGTLKGDLDDVVAKWEAEAPQRAIRENNMRLTEELVAQSEQAVGKRTAKAAK